MAFRFQVFCANVHCQHGVEIDLEQNRALEARNILVDNYWLDLEQPGGHENTIWLCPHCGKLYRETKAKYDELLAQRKATAKQNPPPTEGCICAGLEHEYFREKGYSEWSCPKCKRVWIKDRAG